MLDNLIYIGSNEYVILFSHGNATDLGEMHDILKTTCYTLQTSVFAYDYSGYGQSTGKPNDINIIYDIHAAYYFLIYNLGYEWHNIILYFT